MNNTATVMSDPCNGCSAGWANANSDGSFETCHDNCTMLSIYRARKEMREDVDYVAHERIFGENLAEAKQALGSTFPIFAELLVRFKDAWTVLAKR